MARGYVYLRLQKGHGFCFGKTNDPKRRDREYRKENPFLKNVTVFYAANMNRAEWEMMRRTAHLRLFSNSKEWLRESQEVVTIFAAVRTEFEVSATTAVEKSRNLHTPSATKTAASDTIHQRIESHRRDIEAESQRRIAGLMEFYMTQPTMSSAVVRKPADWDRQQANHAAAEARRTQLHAESLRRSTVSTQPAKPFAPPSTNPISNLAKIVGLCWLLGSAVGFVPGVICQFCGINDSRGGWDRAGFVDVWAACFFGPILIFAIHNRIRTH